MKTSVILTAEETRARMEAQGLNPEMCREFLVESVTLQRANFETLRKILPPRQRNAMELRILNGEIMLSVVNNACLNQSLP